jgi:hypothetical protein
VRSFSSACTIAGLWVAGKLANVGVVDSSFSIRNGLKQITSTAVFKV